MSGEHTKTYTLEELRAMQQEQKGSDWSRFDRMSEAELDKAAEQEERAFGFSPDSYSDAVVVLPVRRPEDVEKERVTIRLDKDVLEYFKKAGKGYQTRINDALRLFMQNMEEQH